MKFLVASALVGAGVSVRYPAFPADWSSMVTQDSVSLSGGAAEFSEGYCCPFDAANCALSVQYDAGLNFNDGTHQRVASFNTDGTYQISIWGEINKQFSMFANGTCQNYCPIDATDFPYENFNVVNCTDVGPSTIDGMKVEGWASYDVEFNSTFDTFTTYVNQQVFSNAYPVLQVDNETPFGNQGPVTNTAYTLWRAGPQNAKHFYVPNEAQCPQSNNCNDDSTASIDMYRATGQKSLMYFKLAQKAENRRDAAQARYYLKKLAAHRERVGLPPVTQEVLPSPVSARRAAAITELRGMAKQARSASVGYTPVFPRDWTSGGSQIVYLNQDATAFKGKDGMCCSKEAGGCSMQLIASEGITYNQFTKNRTAIIYSDNTGIVSLYSLNKEIRTYPPGVCYEYCPIDEVMEPLSIAGYTDMGPTVFNGQSVELYQGQERMPLLNYTAIYDDWFVDIRNRSSPAPVAETQIFNLLGYPCGWMNATYVNFVPSVTPSAEKVFEVSGIDSCPMSQSCNSDAARLLHRRASGQAARFLNGLADYMESTSL